ncbi:transglycosylase SLT domain-containing protein [Leucobacter viscericola]|uniref:Transglycosylase SLT domain-containing protein n=1 Tax=Leucobacter viscericola TaxID=2714935 RepID=A0A6G7XCX9_9MICO|nr:transglycosylase SLT domain-containing protein [Leucobacter viscericola]QIK62228.1 transglycosylase SLT domain-containing protein [Leucobacter viscericola]
MTFWSRFRAPLAVVAVAGFLGAAVVAPFAMPVAPAEAETMAFKARIHQEFVPNESADADLVYTDVSVVELPDPAEVKRKQEAEKAEKAAKAAEAAGASSGQSSSSAPPKYSGGGSPAEWMAAAGIAESDWGYVDYIASRESGWNPNATNAGSGACGLIQALPCSKVPGNGYDPVDNLRWASGYAVGRYGSWAAAYDFWTSNHWW